jgi:hypothetical protein
MTRISLAIVLVLTVLDSASARARPPAQVVPRPDFFRAAQVVEAIVVGTHAYQVRLARQAHLTAPCWGADAVTDADLESLVAHQAGLFASNRLALKDWIAGRDAMRFDPARDLYPLLTARLSLDAALPVSVFTRIVREQTSAPEADVRSVASLYQLILEVDRDGDVLQDAFAFLIGLGLPVYGGQIGLHGDDAAHAALGARLASATCAAPFPTDAAAWTIAGRKVWNWGEKHLGIRNAATVAAEMSREASVQAVLSRLRAAPASRVAVIGDSYTMGNHWASPGSFTTIAAALLIDAHLPIETRHYSAGGLKAARAWRMYGQEVVEWRPTVALLAFEVQSDQDVTAEATWLTALHDAGVRAVMFDDWGDPGDRDVGMRSRRLDVARAGGAVIVPVQARLAAAPDRDGFLSMDGIHMKEPYHRLMAFAWLEALERALSTRPPAKP